MSKEKPNEKNFKTVEDKLRFELIQSKMDLVRLQRDYQKMEDQYNSLMCDYVYLDDQICDLEKAAKEAEEEMFRALNESKKLKEEKEDSQKMLESILKNSQELISRSSDLKKDLQQLLPDSRPPTKVVSK